MPKAKVKMSHHAQARISEDLRYAIAKLASDNQVTEAEIVRDALEHYILQAQQGASFQGPDNGYRIAKSSAAEIARQAILGAFRSLPDTYDEWRAQADQLWAEDHEAK